MTGDRADVQRAVNQVLAAAIYWRDVQAGDNLSAIDDAATDARLIGAVGRYEATRSDTDAARDAFLAKYPTSEAVQDALNELAGTARRFGLVTEARAIVVPGILPDGDLCPCGPNVYPNCPIHGRPADAAYDGAWVLPGGTLCCRRHIDGCPPGTDHGRAWHRLQVRGLNGPDDPQGTCGRHTGNASNRCMLVVGHPDVCDDLSNGSR